VVVAVARGACEQAAVHTPRKECTHSRKRTSAGGMGGGGQSYTSASRSAAMFTPTVLTHDTHGSGVGDDARVAVQRTNATGAGVCGTWYTTAANERDACMHSMPRAAWDLGLGTYSHPPPPGTQTHSPSPPPPHHDHPISSCQPPAARGLGTYSHQLHRHPPPPTPHSRGIHTHNPSPPPTLHPIPPCSPPPGRPLTR